MARWRRAIELAMTEEEIDRLRTVTRSRTEPEPTALSTDIAAIARELLGRRRTNSGVV